jgi:hypothetical protein
MKRLAVPILLVAGVILLPLASLSAGPLGRISVASAASGATLASEVFQPGGPMTVSPATSAPYTPDACQNASIGNSTFNFTASGTAKGPVSGTYSESGTITFGAGGAMSVNGSFTISSGQSQVASGSVNTGSQTAYTGLDQNPPPNNPSGAPFALCTFGQANADIYVDFTAMDGNIQLAVVAEMKVTPLTQNPSTYSFEQDFTTSTTLSCFTSIDMPFNATPIAQGNTIWFPAALQLTGNGSKTPSSVYFTGQTITLGDNGLTYAVPNGTVVFSSTGPFGTTYDPTGSGTWTTTVPLGTSGNTLFAAVPIPVPAGGLPGGVKPVTWQGQISSNVHGLTAHWQWGAAVYTTFGSGPNYTGLNVTSTDGSGLNAGTPTAFEPYVIGGARGGGGSNYTGSWSATASCTT